MPQTTADVRKANMAQIQSPEKGAMDILDQKEAAKKEALRQKYNGMKPAFIPAKDRALMAG